MNSREIEIQNIRKAIEFGIYRGYISFLPGEVCSVELLVNKLITTLLYESQRHGWDSELCGEIRIYITSIYPHFTNQKKEYYAAYITNEERRLGTFFGSYLSEDSDSEEEVNYLNKPVLEKNQILSNAREFIKRAQLEKISYQKRSGNFRKGDLRATGVTASKLFNLNARNRIIHGANVNQNKATRDLNRLNILLARGNSIENAINELSREAEAHGDFFTQFYVAEYRGLTHLTTKWNKPSRKAHRQDKDEIGKPQYSASIYVSSGLSLFRNYAETKQLASTQAGQFEERSETLREILLTFREPKPYSYSNYSYSSLAYVLQNIYTQDFDEFHHLIKSDPIMKEALLNASNPFISMGDTPYHAAKYAYGLKPYAGHKDDRIRPRWRSNGRAERPYSGVIYTSLHPLTDFHKEGPFHLISLNRDAEIKLESELNIIAERETCFPAYLQGNRVVAKHVAKYPSFKERYKEIFQYKYGLNLDLYTKFRNGILQNRPHSIEHKNFKQLLGETLCSYFEVKLIDEARRIAEERGGVLIYRDTNNGFSFEPPVDSVNRNSKKVTVDIKAPVKKKQAIRERYQRLTKKITEIKDEDASLSILDDSFDSEDCYVEGQSDINIPLSLMINAVKGKRYLALRHFLSKPMFQAVINERFNSPSMMGGTLLHLAAFMDDIIAIDLLLNVPSCDLYCMADESINISDRLSFYERITPLVYAIIYHRNIAAKFLLDRIDHTKVTTCDYVDNKNLLSGDMLLYPEPGDDANYLGVAWSCREGVAIYRTRNIGLLYVAIEFGNMEVLEVLLSKRFPLLDISPMMLNHPLDLAISKNSKQAVKLLIDAGVNIEPYQKSRVDSILSDGKTLRSFGVRR